MRIFIPTLFELGLDRLVNLDSSYKFIGKEALLKIKKNGIKRKQVGIRIDCEPLQGSNTTFWPILKDGVKIGKITISCLLSKVKKRILL